MTSLNSSRSTTTRSPYARSVLRSRCARCIRPYRSSSKATVSTARISPASRKTDLTSWNHNGRFSLHREISASHHDVHGDFFYIHATHAWLTTAPSYAACRAQVHCRVLRRFGRAVWIGNSTGSGADRSSGDCRPAYCARRDNLQRRYQSLATAGQYGWIVLCHRCR